MGFRVAVLFALLTAVVCAGTVSAQSVDVYLETGYTTYALGELNELIDAINDGIVTWYGNVDRMNAIKSGYTVAGGIVVPLSNEVSLRAGIDYHTWRPSTGEVNHVLPTVTPLGTVEPGKLTLSGSVLGYVVGGDYLVHYDNNLTVKAAAGIGYYTATKKFVAEEAGDSWKVESKGSGVGFNLGANATWQLNPSFDLTGSVGYRHLKIGEMTTDDDYVILNVDGDPLEIDLSGLNFKVGLVYHF